MTRTRRQSRRHSDGSPDASVDAAEQVPVSTVAAMMEPLQRTQSEALERLLDRIIVHPPSSPISITHESKSGNFSSCTARFSGDNHEPVETFIDAITSYRECKNITSENAIRGMSILLTGSAATWWLSAKTEVATWTDVIDRLRSAYGDRRPAYRLYKELFTMQQGPDKTDIFVAKCRALLTKLPAEDITEKAKLDMVYGLLDRRIRKRLPRDDCSTFTELLSKGRKY
ncbi:hypothetical protein O3G_MSEX002533 [Manduca sexta]|uniref:Ty3 transposon capsid-like protein domain-containing protein n=1 Tax=Manduca sexta TaxID=7130 RepID=A0A922CE14_MANSE|nr:hypothetical protein O3G_MSEX002533 [Manduca sexta]